MIHDPEPNEPARVPKQRTWVPLESRPETKSSPMPQWAREFAATGRLPDAEARRTSAPSDAPETAKDDEARRRYEGAWRTIQRDIDRQKGDAARACVAQGPRSDLGAKAALRGWELDEEFLRLRKLHDLRAPLSLRHFPPLDGAAAGQSVTAQERADAKTAAREPLFVAPKDEKFDDLGWMP